MKKKIIQILMFMQIILGIIFVVKNIDYMPSYGDTKEFLEISQTMELDSYRPFVYPLTLNITAKIANILNINITYVTYFVQGIINLFACFILIKTLKKVFNLEIDIKETILYTLFIFFIPFNTHFNMSIKCDSLATSFTILFICYLMRYLKDEKYRHAIYTCIAMFITSNIRSERIYFLSFVLISLIIIELIKYFVKKKINTKKIITILLIFIIGLITTNISKAVFQDENADDRSQPTVSMYLYERIVGNTLPEIYEYLPENIKQIITYEDAVVSSTDRNYYKLPYETLYKKYGNLEDVNTIMKVAIRRNFPDIISNIVKDFGRNMVSPYYFIVNNEDWSYNYTLTRMEGEHYLFTDMFVVYFNILFIIINVYLVINMTSIKFSECKQLDVIALYAIVSAGFFALLTSQNFHIRYVMPVYILEIAIVTILCNRKQEKIND